MQERLRTIRERSLAIGKERLQATGKGAKAVLRSPLTYIAIGSSFACLGIYESFTASQKNDSQINQTYQPGGSWQDNPVQREQRYALQENLEFQTNVRLNLEIGGGVILSILAPFFIRPITAKREGCKK